MAANPFEGVSVDRIGTDVILRFGDEVDAQQCETVLTRLIPMMVQLAQFLDNGGLFGDL